MKIMKSFEFSDNNRKGKHDWATLLDGKIRQLEEGKDFTSKVGTFVSLAKNAAKRAGKAIRWQKVDGGIVLQAVDADSGDDDDNGGEE